MFTLQIHCLFLQQSIKALGFLVFARQMFANTTNKQNDCNILFYWVNM